jgi:RNA polymerase sigma-70 factor, ECF subfamily
LAAGTGSAAEQKTELEGLIPDEDLLARVAEGDRQAGQYLFKRYLRLIRSIAMRILRDEAEADDLAQDVFLYLQQKSSAFDGSKSSARSWLVQMAYKRAIDRRRYLTIRHFYSHEDIGTGAKHVVGMTTTEDDYSAERVFGRNGLEKVLGSLSEEQRETLRLYFFEGYSLAEISMKLCQHVGNVRHHYYRGLDRLRKQMFRSKVREADAGNKQ